MMNAGFLVTGIYSVYSINHEKCDDAYDFWWQTRIFLLCVSSLGIFFLMHKTQRYQEKVKKLNFHKFNIYVTGTLSLTKANKQDDALQREEGKQLLLL
jgi:hypothetical protein